MEPERPELLNAYAEEAGCRLFRYRDENRYAFLMPEAGKFSALAVLGGTDSSEAGRDSGILETI